MDLYQKELFAISGSKFRAVLQQRIAEQRDRKKPTKAILSNWERTGETQILTTDPEARVMQSKDGYHCYYNVQTAVDDAAI
jgi:transposase